MPLLFLWKEREPDCRCRPGGWAGRVPTKRAKGFSSLTHKAAKAAQERRLKVRTNLRPSDTEPLHAGLTRSKEQVGREEENTVIKKKKK